MKNKYIKSAISLGIFVVVFSTINLSVFSSNEQNNVNSKYSSMIYIPGELFYEDGIVGWIDPKLVDEPSPQKPSKGKIEYKGEVHTEGGWTYISCPVKGKNCGKLYYTIGTTIQTVGWYVETN